jgi:hypothetical protein
LFSKPLGVGEILDRSFQIYRKHFMVAFLLVLVFYGPVYFLYHLLTYNFVNIPLLPQSGESVLESFDVWLGTAYVAEDDVSVGFILFFLLVLPTRRFLYLWRPFYIWYIL